MKPIYQKAIANKFCQQRGQAMTEFTIAAVFVLVPLFLMIPLLGKFLDMKSSTIQASRYAAWERTVWNENSDWTVHADGQRHEKTALEVQAEVQHRFFSSPLETKLQASDMSAGGGAGKLLWSDHAGASFYDTATQTGTRGQTPGTMDEIVDKALTIVNVIDSWLGAKFKLDMDSLYTSSVSLQTVNTTAMSRITGTNSSAFTSPTFNERNVLVANGWSANGPGFVKNQVEGLAVLNLAQRDPLKSGLQVFQSIVGVVYPELKSGSLKLGSEILPDIVPPDRLAGILPAVPPKLTAQQKADIRLAALNKNIQDLSEVDPATITPAARKAALLDLQIKRTQADVDSCQQIKKTEFSTNCPSGTKIGLFCIGYSALNIPYVIKPPGGWGTSYTPIADINPVCSGLPQKIADLEAALADPVLQLAKKTSDDALTKYDAQYFQWSQEMAKYPEGSNDPLVQTSRARVQLTKPMDLRADAVFMADRNKALNQIADYQAKIDDLKGQLNAL